MKIYFVDRIENTFAVCEDENGDVINISINKLPVNLHEGDCINLFDNGEYVINKAETENKRKQNAELFKSLLNN